MTFCGNCTREKLNLVVAAFGGTLFSLGWWLMIDVNASYPDVIYDNKVYYLPGLFASAALVIVNIVPTAIIKESYFYTSDNYCGPLLAVCVLFVGFLVAFGSMIGACYIFINDFLLLPRRFQWPGAGIFLQNLCIFSANMLVKFGIAVDVY